MAITDKKQGVWDTWEVYNKANEGDWTYAPDPVGLWTFGRNNPGGGLGLNDSINRSSPTQVGSMPAPGAQYDSVSIGEYTMVATKTDGTLWTWGSNMFGMLGQNAGPGDFSSPVQVGTDTDWSKAFTTPLNSAALKTDGTFWIWGLNNVGQLGVGNKTNYSSPMQLPGTWTGDNNEFDLRSSYRRTALLKGDGTLWLMGDGNNGRLGFNNQTQYSSPKQMPAGSGKTWVNIGGAGGQLFGAKDDGTLWGWGDGDGYALSQSTTSYSSPKEIPGTGWGGPIVGFSQGALALKTNGELYSWGTPGTNDRAGILGQNSTQVSPPPQQVGTDTYSDIECTSQGAVHAIKTDGTLWVWGGGLYGILGLNSETFYSSPVQMPGDWPSTALCHWSGGWRSGLKK